MRLGIALRNMGAASAPEILVRCAQAADQAGLDSLWVTDHVAIPPDDAEGSGGRYLDPLATLAFLGGCTQRIGLGTGVLVLPYRPPLPTAKWVATVQELCRGRLLLGVGVGWMNAEFRALGLSRKRRGSDSDAVLAFLRRCFDAEEVEANGQPFLFRPRPARPPIYVGGRPPHAFERVLRYADGWLPIGLDPTDLAPQVEALRARAAAEGREAPAVVSLGALPLEEPQAALDRARAYRDAGVTHLIHGLRYDVAAPFLRAVDALRRVRDSVYSR